MPGAESAGQGQLKDATCFQLIPDGEMLQDEVRRWTAKDWRMAVGRLRAMGRHEDADRLEGLLPWPCRPQEALGRLTPATPPRRILDALEATQLAGALLEATGGVAC